MHREPAMLENVLAARSSGAVVSVAGVPDRVDERAAGPQDSPYFLHDGMDFFGRERHTQRHMRIHRVDGRVLERQGLTEVVHYRRDPRGQAFCTGDVAELIERNATEVSRNHPEALRGEMKSIASMTGRQLE